MPAGMGEGQLGQDVSSLASQAWAGVKKAATNYFTTGQIRDQQTDATRAQDKKNQEYIQQVDKNPFRFYLTGSFGYEHDKNAAINAQARQVKDVSSLPTPILRMQAVQGKLQRLYSDERFLGLRPENKIKVLGHYYDKYVYNSLLENGIVPPSKEEWLAGYTSKEQYAKGFEEPKNPLMGQFLSSAASGQADVYHMLSRIFNFASQESTGPKGQSNVYSRGYGYLGKKLQDASDYFANVNTTYNSSFAVDRSSSAWLVNMGGHLVGELPAYIAVGGVGDAVVPAMSERAALSKGIKVAVNNLRVAGEVFTVDEGEGKGLKQSSIDAASAAIISSGLSGAWAGTRKLVGGLVDGIGWGASKLGYGGKPFANTIGEAEGIKAPIATNGTDEIVAMRAESAHRDQIARRMLAAHPDGIYSEKLEKFPDSEGRNSLWNNLSKGQRRRVQEYIDAQTEHAAELMPIAAPEVQQAANLKELTQARKANSGLDKRIAAMEQLSGVKAEQAVTQAQAENVAHKIGLNSPTQIFEQTFGSDPFGENLSRSKGLRTISNTTLTSTRDLDTFLSGTRKYLEPNKGSRSVEGKEFFENPEHHLLWVAAHSDAPEAVKKNAFNLLRNEFKLNKDEAIKRAGWLAEHRSDLAETGLLSKEGNVYRSTKLGQRRFSTSYAKELYTEDLAKADLKAVNKMLATKPELRPQVEGLFEQLTELRNKAATPLTSRTRRDTQRAIRDLIARYK